MTTPHPPPVSIRESLESDERCALTHRVVGSRHFAKAAQLRELLLYLTKCAIVSPGGDVSEQEIGWRVLGRKQDYDPQADNIVRVQIRRLRQKLEEYFADEGRNEGIVISIPKGGHVVHFDLRVAPLAGEPVAVSAPPARIRWEWHLTAAVVLVVVAFAMGSFYAQRQQPALPAEWSANSPLWGRIFVREQPTSIVMADSSVVIVQNVLGKSLTLNEYIDRKYQRQVELVPNPALREMLEMVAGRQYTSLADATLTSELRLIGHQMGARVGVRFARHLNIRDFGSGNYILIGSTHGVPWVELFERNLNFQFGKVGAEQRFGFRNRTPLKGELAEYVSGAPMSGPQENFATISLAPNLAHNGNVLMLNGVTMEATEAAGEFAMSPEFSSFVASTFGATSAEKLPYFQVLLKSASMAGAPHKVGIVSWRKLDLQ